MAIVDSSSYSHPEFSFKKMASFGGVYYLLETLRIEQNVDEGSPQGRTSVCTPFTS